MEHISAHFAASGGNIPVLTSLLLVDSLKILNTGCPITSQTSLLHKPQIKCIFVRCWDTLYRKECRYLPITKIRQKWHGKMGKYDGQNFENQSQENLVAVESRQGCARYIKVGSAILIQDTGSVYKDPQNVSLV